VYLLRSSSDGSHSRQSSLSRPPVPPPPPGVQSPRRISFSPLWIPEHELPVLLPPLCPPLLLQCLLHPVLGCPGRFPSPIHHLQASAFNCLHRLAIRPNSLKCIKPEHSPVQSLPYPGPPSPEDTFTSAMGSLSVSDPSQKKTSEPPSLTAPLPTISSLIAALPSVQTPNNTPASKIAWCRDVIGLVDRLYVAPNSNGLCGSPLRAHPRC
jgi:hypothetical protein